MKIKIMAIDSEVFINYISNSWLNMGLSTYNSFRRTIENYIFEIFTKFELYGYHYIGEWETREECIDFIKIIMKSEFERVLSPLAYEGIEIGGATSSGLNGNAMPIDFTSIFVSEISEDISGKEGMEKTVIKTQREIATENNRDEKTFNSTKTFQSQKGGTITNIDTSVIKETNSGEDSKGIVAEGVDQFTFGKITTTRDNLTENNSTSSSRNDILERSPINANNEDIYAINTPFSKDATNGSSINNKEVEGLKSEENEGGDSKVYSSETTETMTHGKVVDIDKNDNKQETISGDESGSNTEAITDINVETKSKDSNITVNDTDNKSGTSSSERDLKKSDKSKTIDDIIKSHEYINKVRNYFYSIVYEWLSRFVDELNMVY